MTSGYEKNLARRESVSLLGKELARRAKSRCELCGAGGVRLTTFEVPPVPDEPVLGHCLLLCEPCHSQLGRRGGPESDYWRFLETAAWSETPAVQVTAVRILRQVDEAWARALLDQLYLWPESEEWLEDSR